MPYEEVPVYPRCSVGLKSGLRAGSFNSTLANNVIIELDLCTENCWNRFRPLSSNEEKIVICLQHRKTFHSMCFERCGSILLKNNWVQVSTNLQCSCLGTSIPTCLDFQLCWWVPKPEIVEFTSHYGDNRVLDQRVSSDVLNQCPDKEIFS